MDELHGFCVRMLGPGEAAQVAAQAARDAGDRDRVRALAAAAAACRAHALRAPSHPGATATATATATHGATPPPDAASDPSALARTVARELEQATAALPEAQREALALRDLLALSYREIADVLGMDAMAVAPLLARARLGLRFRLRGEPAPAPPCDERERALRTIALRVDDETVPAADDDWLIEHLGHCLGCAQAHSAMLEASACYRGWRADEDLTAADRAGPGQP